MPKYPINKLITDFDGTVSEQDTINLLVYAAADNCQRGKAQFLAAWQKMVGWYSTRYNRIRDEWLGNRQSLVTRHSSLVDFLKAFEELESASIQKVMDKGLLAGLTREGLRAIGRKVVKKPGVDRVLSTMRADGVETEILSANWSKALIEGAMGELCDQVITNCLTYDAAGCSTGSIHLHVVSAQDKLRKFRERKCVPLRQESHTHRQGKEPSRTLYIGDSISDFLAILDADLGVLIGQNRTAMQTSERFHLPMQELREGMRFDSARHYQGTILRVDSWEALDGFLSTA
jgi:2-hydroxy-3-keto-5-methylthiopentenyl-1-phosphate phosphatase